ncbi:MAG: GTPase Era [Acidobacteria bacterium]|jgi:GTP-binding protein Era|nr:GTPase Era [Acidobacteriota bacterium]
MTRTEARHSGYVALVGRTNVGKSTFLNALIGAKIAIVSAKPQTTRRKVLGIKTTERGQAIFFDCPGIHKPHFRLNERMMKEVRDALHDADLVLYFVDIGAPQADEFIFALLAEAASARDDTAGKPVFLVINKIDTLSKGRILEKIQEYKDAFPWKEIIPISALKGDNLDLIEDLIFRCLPAGEDFYPAEETTLQGQAFYVGELIREKVLDRVEDELPFTTTLKVEEIKDRGEVVYVRAEIFVENPAQKKIVIGRQGGLIKRIGTDGRLALEEYFAKKVFLDLHVKVVPNWRNSPQVLHEIFD